MDGSRFPCKVVELSSFDDNYRNARKANHPSQGGNGKERELQPINASFRRKL